MSSALARVTQINDISSVLNDSNKFLEEIKIHFGWENETSISEQDCIKSAKCPINENHVMEPCFLDKHICKCHLKSLGVDPQRSNCQSSCFYYKSSPSVVSVLSDERNSETAVPIEVLHSKQSTEERLNSYNEIVEIGKSKRKVNELETANDVQSTENTLQGDGHEFKTKLEMLAEQRDYKRRRQSYRAKNVHITKRSTTDIMREIIENKMQELQQIWKEEDKKDDVLRS